MSICDITKPTLKLIHHQTCLFQSGGELSSQSSRLSSISSSAGGDSRAGIPASLAKDGSENGEVDYKKVSPKIQCRGVGKKMVET
jgi:hypothetical protein